MGKFYVINELEQRTVVVKEGSGISFHQVAVLEYKQRYTVNVKELSTHREIRLFLETQQDNYLIAIPANECTTVEKIRIISTGNGPPTCKVVQKQSSTADRSTSRVSMWKTYMQKARSALWRSRSAGSYGASQPADSSQSASAPHAVSAPQPKASASQTVAAAPVSVDSSQLIVVSQSTTAPQPSTADCPPSVAASDFCETSQTAGASQLGGNSQSEGAPETVDSSLSKAASHSTTGSQSSAADGPPVVGASDSVVPPQPKALDGSHDAAIVVSA